MQVYPDRIYIMKKSCFTLLTLMITIQIFVYAAFSGNKKQEAAENTVTSPEQYTVYVVNNNMHTGLVIPVYTESNNHITAINYLHDARAILKRNTSVIRIEGYTSFEDIFIGFSDFTIQFNLTTEQFTKLMEFIENSFRKDVDSNLIITSKSSSGDIIFFKSVPAYHLFHTCNKWIIESLEYAGLEVSPFFIITRKQLYDRIKNHGIVLKHLK